MTLRILQTKRVLHTARVSSVQLAFCGENADEKLPGMFLRLALPELGWLANGLAAYFSCEPPGWGLNNRDD
jgi:hypothetical protein